MPQKRNRRNGVEDRWYKSDGQRAGRYGIGMRWRARYVDDDQREHTKAFARKVDAQKWLDGVTAQFTTGTYVAPEAGRATVAAVYASWSAAQSHISAKTALTRASSWNKIRLCTVGGDRCCRRENVRRAGMGFADGRGRGGRSDD